MLRASDFLLTLAAFFLLNAALNSSSRHKGAVIVASASQPTLGPNHRKSETEFNLLMHKIKRNLEKSQADIRPSSADLKAAPTSPRPASSTWQQANHTNALENSYHYFANKTGSSASKPAEDALADELPTSSNNTSRAHQVQVKSLRSLAAANQDALQASKSNSSDTLYLLSYLAATSSAPQDDSSNEIDVGEQQQAPIGYPPLNGQHNSGQDNLRQILNNYQRYPHTGVLMDQHNRPLSQQMAPRPNQASQQPYQALFGNLFPARQAQPAQPGSLAGQPISPLQLITAPFQAFLPGLTPQPPQATNQQAHQQLSAQHQHRAAAGLPAGQPSRPKAPQRSQPSKPAAQPVLEQPPPPPLPLTPPTSIGLPNQMGTLAQPQPPSLQAIYQQLPLYQALLAARQRQEAMEAAQKLRQRQQQPNAGQSALGLAQQLPGPPQPPQNQQLPPGLGSLALPLPPPTTSSQQTPQSLSNPWQVQPPPFIPHQANQLAGQAPSLQPVQQPQPPAEPTRQPVDFDDDNETNTAKPDDQSRPGENNELTNAEQPHQGGADQAEPEQNGHSEEPANEQQQQPPTNEPENEQGDSRQPDHNEPTTDSQQGSGHNDQAGQSPGYPDQAPARAEEEDPDLKQFQNLANGGDSFTDLFPPGILSNNDINEIKSQQEEQARKQEQEERQRQLRNQRNQQEGSGTGLQAEPPGDQSQRDDDNGSQDENSSGGNDGTDEQAGGSDDEARLNGPTAAALITAKSSHADSTSKRSKFTSSPGVVYAN